MFKLQLTQSLPLIGSKISEEEKSKSHISLNDAVQQNSDQEIQRLNLLQIQYDDMRQVSARLYEERDILMIENRELNTTVSVLREQVSEAETLRSELKNKIHDLQTELDATKTILRKTIEANEAVRLKLISENK